MFTVCNVALDAVVSDMFGVSATSITDYIVNSDTFDPEHCVSLLKKPLKKKADEVVASIDGFQMTDAQKLRSRMVKAHYDYLLGHIEKLDAVIDELAKPLEPAIVLLTRLFEKSRLGCYFGLPSWYPPGVLFFKNCKALCLKWCTYRVAIYKNFCKCK